MQIENDILKNAIAIAEKAGAEIKRLRGQNAVTEELKFGYELVTSADLKANEIITSEITRQYPTHNIISEESLNKRMDIDAPTWVVDPIDGTVAYANNQYQCAVSIAYGNNGAIEVGVVFNPFLNELFYAVKGKGAYLNDQKIAVKQVDDLSGCVIATGFPHKKENLEPIIANLAAVLPHIRDLRRLGSAALDMCWVACGRVQGYYEGSLNAWDMAAARLIAVEAGAIAGNFGGINNPGIAKDIWGVNVLVCSPGIYVALYKLLK